MSDKVTREELIQELAYWCVGKMDDEYYQAIRDLIESSKVSREPDEQVDPDIISGNLRISISEMKQAYYPSQILDSLMDDWRSKFAKALTEAGVEVEEEEPKQYRCEGCGRIFDQKIFSHSRAEMGWDGNPIEIECGPIVEVEVEK